jgi:pimeloyl-ACP methyl ester carboxylesterase
MSAETAAVTGDRGGDGVPSTEFADDDLVRFEACGAAPLPPAVSQGHVDRDGGRLWYAAYGEGAPVVLLHGGLGHSGNWGRQLPALLGAGYRVVLIDSRGHGRSTRDARPLRYESMAADVAAVMDRLRLERAALVGWSDGAVIALLLAMASPSRVAGVFFFACNVDPSGVKQVDGTNPVLRRCMRRHAADHRLLSPTPEGFPDLAEAVGRMQATQPDVSVRELEGIRVPVAIAHAEHDEFIRREHAEHLARSIPGADLIELRSVSHFAPLQRPAVFNGAMLAFLDARLRWGDAPDTGVTKNHGDPRAADADRP